jgi:hypothetical protein
LDTSPALSYAWGNPLIVRDSPKFLAIRFLNPSKSLGGGTKANPFNDSGFVFMAVPKGTGSPVPDCVSKTANWNQAEAIGTCLANGIFYRRIFASVAVWQQPLIAPGDDLRAAEVVLQPRQRILNSTGFTTHCLL